MDSKTFAGLTLVIIGGMLVARGIRFGLQAMVQFAFDD